MSKQRKTWLLIMIYLLTFAICTGIIWLISSLTPKRTEVDQSEQLSVSESPLPEETKSEETSSVQTSTVPEDTQKHEDKFRFERQTDEYIEESKEETQQETKPSIIIASDTHYYPPELTDYQSAFQTMLSREDDGKVVPYISQILDAFFDEVLKQKPSALVLSGDLSFNGERAGHEGLAKKLGNLQDQGIPVLVIPGNHDINKPNAASYYGDETKPVANINAEEFYEIYHSFGYDQAISQDETSLSYLYALDQSHWLMLLDSCQYEPYNRVGGRIRESTLTWMKEQLEIAKEAGVTVLPIAHHNLLKESILYPDDCTIENSQEVINLLEAYHIPLFISGHLHLRRTKKYKPEPGEPADVYHIFEIVSDSLAISPNQYGILKWTEDDGLKYHTKETDLSGWAAKHGITDENLLNFEEYSLSFLTDLVSNQIYHKMSNLPKEQMRKMAELYGNLNRDYCAGNPIDAVEVRSSEAFRLWERNLPDSKMFQEIDDILRDTRYDHNEWVELPGK